MNRIYSDKQITDMIEQALSNRDNCPSCGHPCHDSLECKFTRTEWSGDDTGIMCNCNSICSKSD